MHLSLRESFIANNSYISITDIGEGRNGALICFTDNSSCCNINGRGWFFPNRSVVSVNVSSIYFSRGPSMLSFNRRNNAMPPSGLYCCDIPDADGNIMRMCANICKSLHAQCIYSPPKLTFLLLTMCSFSTGIDTDELCC